MDDRSPTPQAPVPAGAARRRAPWPLAAVAIVAVVGAGAGAYFGLRGAAGPGSGPGVSPPARAFAAAAYDEASHQVVLFGGIGSAGPALDDTWTWDGSAWTQQHPSSSPSARAFASMTYDPRGRDVVLVGGRTAAKPTASVCSGSGKATGPNAPPAASWTPVPCFSTSATPFFDTWLWDGSTWHQAGSAPTGLLGQSPALGTDPTTGQVVLLAQAVPTTIPGPVCPVPLPPVAGTGPIAQPAIACAGMPVETLHAWSWSGGSWTELPAPLPAAGPGIAIGGPGALASDPVSGHLVDVRSGALIACGAGIAESNPPVPCPLNAGSAGASGSSLRASSSAQPTTAVAAPPAAHGPITGSPSLPVQPGSLQPVPMPSSVPMPAPNTCCAGSVATWSGSAWSQPESFDSGPNAGQAQVVGDPAHHDLVAVTAQGTWSWNGSAWTQRHPATAPPPLVGAALVYDGASGRVLLFGGEPVVMGRSSSPPSQPPAIPVTDELWAWDGSTWTQLSGAQPPAAPSLSPPPTPTFVPPSTPRASALPSGTPTKTPSPTVASCTPAPTPTPGKTTVTSTGPNVGCAVPSARPVAPG